MYDESSGMGGKLQTSCGGWAERLGTTTLLIDLQPRSKVIVLSELVILLLYTTIPTPWCHKLLFKQIQQQDKQASATTRTR